jgi:hypothetical protein
VALVGPLLSARLFNLYVGTGCARTSAPMAQYPRLGKPTCRIEIFRKDGQKKSPSSLTQRTWGSLSLLPQLVGFFCPGRACVGGCCLTTLEAI